LKWDPSVLFHLFFFLSTDRSITLIITQRPHAHKGKLYPTITVVGKRLGRRAVYKQTGDTNEPSLKSSPLKKQTGENQKAELVKWEKRALSGAPESIGKKLKSIVSNSFCRKTRDK
jgi:hypothetical protein